MCYVLMPVAVRIYIKTHIRYARSTVTGLGIIDIPRTLTSMVMYCTDCTVTLDLIGIAALIVIDTLFSGRYTVRAL